MQNNKSTMSLSIEINSDSDTPPQTTNIVWPNLNYEQVLFLQEPLLEAFVIMNKRAQELNNKLKEEAEHKASVALAAKPAKPAQKRV